MTADAPTRAKGPLTQSDIDSFNEKGFLFPIRVLDSDGVAELRAALEEHLAGGTDTPTYELLDPTNARGGETNARERYSKEDKPAASPRLSHSVPFLFNLWERDERFRRVVEDPVIVGIARQLMNSEGVVLLEDGAVIKNPHQGGALHWHQDYPVWPLATPDAVTCWIALDRVTKENGAMEVAVGSHAMGERLPVEFGSGRSFMHERRPGVPEITDPSEIGLEVVPYELEAGECGFHHSLTWHASGPNTTDMTRWGYVPRYVASGTTWLGSERFPYNFNDEEVGIAIGDPIGGPHFPTLTAAF